MSQAFQTRSFPRPFTNVHDPCHSEASALDSVWWENTEKPGASTVDNFTDLKFSNFFQPRQEIAKII